MNNLNEIVLGLLDSRVDVCDPESAIRYVTEAYGKDVGKKVKKDGAFCCFVKFKANPSINYSAIDFLKKMSDYKDFESYKKEVYKVLEDLGTFNISIG